MKDIFVDSNLAKNLANPISDTYKQFMVWLTKEGILITNQKLLTEYIAGNQTLAVIINRLQAQGRLKKLSNQEIQKFNFSKSEDKNLRSNYKDRIHLKTVLISNRKIAISMDKNFAIDINSFRTVDGKKPMCKDCPSKLKYK